MIILCHNIKDKRMIFFICCVSLWPMLGKEIWYFYTRHPKNDDLWIIFSLLFFLFLFLFLVLFSYFFVFTSSLCALFMLYFAVQEILRGSKGAVCFRHHCLSLSHFSLSLSLAYLMDVFVFVCI